jgi:hypothetical protein
MSSQIFHRTPDGRIQEITAGEQLEPRILESFDPVTQDKPALRTCKNRITAQGENKPFYEARSELTLKK